MDESAEWLGEVAKRLKTEREQGAAQHPEETTVRGLVNRFGFERRGSWINGHIHNILDQFELETIPDFSTVWLDSRIAIRLDSSKFPATSSNELADATQRIGSMPTANLNAGDESRLVSVPPDKPLSTATTIMQLSEFSQLPVMPNGNKRIVRGIISWKSIGARLTLGAECGLVQDCMENPAQILPITTPLVEAMSIVTKHGYVLVKKEDETISGIITASDLASQFETSAVPFILTGEIEGHLRRLIHGKFTLDEMRETAKGTQGGKPIAGASDLTLTGYHALLGKPEHWERLQINVDRDQFRAHLEIVRDIRNNLMHFNPDGLSSEEIAALRNLARFFEDLVRFGAM